MADCKGFCRQGNVAPPESSALPDPVREALAVALADERKAWRTYSIILDRFPGARPFVNIVEAEARHIEALLRVYERHGLTPPADEAICDRLAGTAPFEMLCKIGVDAEIENVRLFDEALLPAVAGYPDISAVFQRLRDASKWRHLPAFRRCAKGEPHRARRCGRDKNERSGQPVRTRR
jgi:hypothetical protein